MAEGATTRVDEVYARVRADILAGREEPGSRLALARLVERYGASMGVTREALSRLAAQGLVETEPQRGFRVPPISSEDLGHLTEARVELEALVFKQSMESGGLPWEGQVLSTHHTLSRTPRMVDGDPDRVADEWSTAHRAFHSALLSACPNPRLRSMAEALRDSAELYQRWSIPLEKGRDISGEHDELRELALSGQVEQACQALRAHIRHTSDVLLHSAVVTEREE